MARKLKKTALFRAIGFFDGRWTVQLYQAVDYPRITLRIHKERKTSEWFKQYIVEGADDWYKTIGTAILASEKLDGSSKPRRDADRDSPRRLEKKHVSKVSGRSRHRS